MEQPSIYLMGLEEAVQGMRMVETPVSKGRTVLADYGIPVDVLKWTGADHEAPGQKQC